MKPSRLLIFSPLPPLTSGIAGYTDFLASRLSQVTGLEVTVVVDQEEVPGNRKYSILNWRKFLYSPFPKNAIPIYQIGNHFMHAYEYPFLFSYPGVVTLHDYVLGHGRVDLLRTAYSAGEIRDELHYECGVKQGEQLREILMRRIGWKDAPFSMRLNRSVVRAARLTISHNPDTFRLLRKENPDRVIRYVPMGYWRSGLIEDCFPSSLQAMRRSMGLDEKDFLVGCFGAVTSYKLIETMLAAHKALRSLSIPAHLVIVGYGDSRDSSLADQVQSLGLQSSVHVIRNCSKEEYDRLMSSVNVACSLRFPPAGEFSLSVLELMAARRPVIMNQHRFNVYLDNSICFKVSNSNMVQDLVNTLKFVYTYPDMAIETANRAYKYIQENHGIDLMIEGYVEALETVQASKTDVCYDELPVHFHSLRSRVMTSIQRRLGTLPPEILGPWNQAFPESY